MGVKTLNALQNAALFIVGRFCLLGGVELTRVPIITGSDAYVQTQTGTFTVRMNHNGIFKQLIIVNKVYMSLGEFLTL